VVVQRYRMGYRGERKSEPPERVAIRAAKSEGALPPFRDRPSDHGLDGRVFEAYLCFRGVPPGGFFLGVPAMQKRLRREVMKVAYGRGKKVAHAGGNITRVLR